MRLSNEAGYERRKDGHLLRVITGTARGMKLETLEGNGLRPTADSIKEAIFSIIQFEIEGRSVLDLFAGSGQLGVEALSRGAASATFVDENNDAVAMIKQNLTHTKLFPKARVAGSDFHSYLTHCRTVFDIALLDPPYSKGLIDASLPLVAPLMSPGGVIICEAARIDPLPEAAGEFVLQRTYRHGKTIVGLYRRPDPERLNESDENSNLPRQL